MKKLMILSALGLMLAPAAALAVGGDTCASPPPVIGSLPFNDTGDTCGFNDDLNSYTGACTLAFPYPGEDVIYEITVGTGNSITYTADLTGSTGDLALFLIGTCGDGTSCVLNSQDAIGPGAGPEVLDATAGVAPGTYYLYVDSYYTAGTAGSCGTYTLDVTGTLPVELLEFKAE